MGSYSKIYSIYPIQLLTCSVIKLQISAILVCRENHTFELDNMGVSPYT